jgi:hypothetical protein
MANGLNLGYDPYTVYDLLGEKRPPPGSVPPEDLLDKWKLLSGLAAQKERALFGGYTYPQVKQQALDIPAFLESERLQGLDYWQQPGFMEARGEPIPTESEKVGYYQPEEIAKRRKARDIVTKARTIEIKKQRAARVAEIQGRENIRKLKAAAVNTMRIAEREAQRIHNDRKIPYLKRLEAMKQIIDDAQVEATEKNAQAQAKMDELAIGGNAYQQEQESTPPVDYKEIVAEFTPPRPEGYQGPRPESIKYTRRPPETGAGFDYPQDVGPVAGEATEQTPPAQQARTAEQIRADFAAKTITEEEAVKQLKAIGF